MSWPLSMSVGPSSSSFLSHQHSEGQPQRSAPGWVGTAARPRAPGPGEC